MALDASDAENQVGTKLLTEAGFGLPFERPIARLREFRAALRQFTQAGAGGFHGELLTATTPIPARVPGAESGVPLLVAGTTIAGDADRRRIWALLGELAG